MAKEKGWIKTGEFSHKEIIYDRGSGHNPQYVSYDNTNHNGGTWKGANDVSEFGSNERTRYE